MSPAIDEFLPGPPVPPRVLRRTRRSAKRRRVTGGLIALVLLGGLILALVANSDDPPARRADDRRSVGRPARRSANRPTSISDPSPPLASTSSEPPTSRTAVLPPRDTKRASESAPSPDPDPAPADPSVAGRVSIDPKSCRYDADQQKLLAFGTVQNSSNSEISAEIEVTWSDSTGEIDTWSDLETVGAGASVPWSISDEWFESPDGALSCQATSV